MLLVLGHGESSACTIGVASGRATAALNLAAMPAAVAGQALHFAYLLYDAPLAYQLAHRAREVGRTRAYEEVFTDLAPLFAEADVVSLHVPETPSTRNMIDADALAAMRPGSLLINAARGTVVDIDAGVTSEGRIAFWDYLVMHAGERGSGQFYDIPHHREAVYGEWRIGPGIHPFAVGPWRAPAARASSACAGFRKRKRSSATAFDTARSSRDRDPAAEVRSRWLISSHD